MLTVNDLCDRLMQIDEISILEVLDIDAEMLVERFRDRVEERYDYLLEELEERVKEEYYEEDEDY